MTSRNGRSFEVIDNLNNSSLKAGLSVEGADRGQAFDKGAKVGHEGGK